MNTATKRPTIHNEAVLEHGTQVIAKILARWCEEGKQPEDYLEDAKKVVSKATYSDGYGIAKELDHLGYDPDYTLVEELDSVGVRLRCKLEEVIKAWVKTENIVISFAESDVVTYRRYRGKGIVHKLIPEEAVLHVCFAEEGHAPGKRAAVCNCEDLTKVVS
jgi:hypothetical protein